MERKVTGEAARASERTGGGLAKRMLAAGDGWSVHEVVCRAGPSDKPFEERHEGYSISAVVEGNFSYRSDTGHGFLYPGALLLGNSGRCFECRHAHGQGDRCVSLNLREDLFDEIAAGAALTDRFRFPAASLPPTPKALPVVTMLEGLSSDAEPLRREELAMLLLERVVGALADRRRPSAAPTGREARRVMEAIRSVESGFERPNRLEEMARIAGMSKYHFLRVFRKLAGVTPHQYLIAARMRRAALGLSQSRRPVLAVALDAGFGDLSTFNRRFRETFGVTRTRYRAAAA